MDDVPPIHLVEREIDRVVEGEQEEDRQTPQAEKQDVGDGGLAALQRGHGDVEQEHQHDDDDADLDREGLLEELPPLMDAEEIADHGDRRRDEEQPELHHRDLAAVELGLRLFRQQVIGRAHEAEQQPDHQGVGVDHPHDVEGQQLG